MQKRCAPIPETMRTNSKRDAHQFQKGIALQSFDSQENRSVGSTLHFFYGEIRTPGRKYKQAQKRIREDKEHEPKKVCLLG